MTSNDTSTTTLPATNEKNELLAQSFKELPLSEIGIAETDYEKVIAACGELETLDQASVSFFGQGLAQNSQKFTDELLVLVQNKDLDHSGKKLDEVLVLAKSVNAKSLLNPDNKSIFKRGFLGKLLGHVVKAKGDFLAGFNNTKEQIDSLVAEIEQTQSGLAERVKMLQLMHTTVDDERKQLGVYIAAGEIKRKELALKIEELSTLQTQNPTNELASQIFDLNSVANSLEKRVHDLKMLQESARQTMPMIRVIQSNNSMLVDKFNAIKTVTLPAWKTQFTLALSLNEQKNAVELVANVDDATNDMLRNNADLLKTNSINTAKANQRSVIDYSTLEYVQNSLISTISEVGQIQRTGMEARDKATKDLKVLQQNLNSMTLTNAVNSNLIAKN